MGEVERFTLIAQAIVAARQARDALGDADADEVLVVAFDALARRFRIAADDLGRADG